MGKQFDVSVKLTGESRGAVAAAQKTEGAFRKLTSYLSRHFVITLGDVTRAASAAMGALRESLDLSAQEKVLRRQLASAGQGFDDFIAKAQAAAHGTLSMKDIISNATRARLLGVGFDEMIKLLEISRVSAVATGATVAKAFDDITLGIARESRMILDNQGFVINMTAAHEAMAAQLGKNVEELTKTERKQSLLNTILAQGEERVKNFGDAAGGLKEKLEQAEAGVADLQTAVGKLFKAFAEGATATGTGTEAINEITATLEKGEGAFAGWGAALAVWAKELIKTGDIQLAWVNTMAKIPKIAGETSEALKKAADAEAELAEKAQDAAAGLEDAGEAAETAAGHFKTTEEAAIGLGNALDEVTSTELELQITKINEALDESTENLDKNSAEYIRLERIAAEKIQRLRDRIQNLRDGLGDLTAKTEESNRAWDGYAAGVTRAAVATDVLTASTRAAAAELFRGDFARQQAERRSRGQDDWVQIGGGTFTYAAPIVVVDPDGRLRPV